MQDFDTSKEGNKDYIIELVHYRQKKSWDCGLSCIMMILPEKSRQFFIHNFDEICKAEGFDRSTWTIDLCYLMKKFSLDFIFYTRVFGINPEHNSHYFYEKILLKDEKRVVERFRDAKKNGIDVRIKSVRTKDIITHLKNHGPIIVLVNAEHLYCDICKRNRLTPKLIHCFPQANNYHGHYIILCGFDLKNEQFYYRNPACSNRVCAMEYSAMNKARLSFGTDEDCIFVYK